MSHTTDLGQGWIAIHDGDFEGEVTLREIVPGRKKPLNEVTIPASVLLQFAAEVVRSTAIQQLERATSHEILWPNVALAARIERLERGT